MENMIEFCLNNVDKHASYITYLDKNWESANFWLTEEEYKTLEPIWEEVKKVLDARLSI